MNIYIRLLNEGTIVYRPVPATELEKNVYEVEGLDIYNPEDEIWEFLPGTFVVVEPIEINGVIVLVAKNEFRPL
ncbi:hypothetical protein [Flavihumibacter profundi]|uniref:hypothetical protein n=1 Tax=Flavihumibacter profundi TaxID=2716883 RepID=UPI001CC5880D|nr:hypothetical protein [Flavihumibacter profundi]MBZ5856407.1 hypothetical protein [Flavihumibacter profundi]